LRLAAWSFEPVALRVFQPFKKLFTAGQVTGWQRAMIISKPWQQVIVFNSFHLVSSPSSLDQPSPAEGSPPGRLLLFLFHV